MNRGGRPPKGYCPVFSSPHYRIYLFEYGHGRSFMGLNRIAVKRYNESIPARVFKDCLKNHKHVDREV